MGDRACEVVVQTQFESAQALLNALGSSVQRGRICLPMRIDLETAFEIVLATRGGERVVQGRVVVIARESDSTWVRFEDAAEVDEAESVNHALSTVHVTYPQAIAAHIAFAEGSSKIAARGSQRASRGTAHLRGPRSDADQLRRPHEHRPADHAADAFPVTPSAIRATTIRHP